MAKSLQLLLRIGNVVTTPAPRALLDALRSVQVTASSGQRSGFQLSFAVSKRSVITETMLPAGLLDPPARVIIVAIVGGSAEVLMDGVITRHELAPSDTPGASTLTVTGEDLLALMDFRTEHACYPAMPHNVRVLLVLLKYAMYGIVPAVLPPVIPTIPNPLDQIPIQSSTDLVYLNALAEEVGYTFFLTPGPEPGMSVAYWGPDVRAGLLQPALTVNSGAASNVESLSFSFDGLSRTQYTVRITEPNTKIGVALPIPSLSLLKPPLAARPAVTLKEEPLVKITDRSVPDAMLRAISMTSKAADAVTGQGKLDVLRYGHVLKSRHLVGVRGAGLNYDGLYYVTSVTHEIKPGEYKQSFSLSRDGFVPFSDRVLP
ncbi:MAG TPA: hypothetical protein VGX25_00145 [Actinophytocola sp.]|uniref:hypothetical protein n=1 Tax=Actinophytocola sp. TaxID=1872138 RepID=UPI002DDD2026|nr:hypothetical protein [Actinophytocola sp.]HEV2777787.1 hypothetical protein [Actinophytocola sp.]